jgi:hypothetical protein
MATKTTEMTQLSEERGLVVGLEHHNNKNVKEMRERGHKRSGRRRKKENST